MTSANPDDERELPSLPPRRIAGAVVVSLSVHGAALLGLMRMTMSDADAHVAMDLPSISVALVTRAPRPVLAAPEPLTEPGMPPIGIPLESPAPVISPETELAEARESAQALLPELAETVPAVGDPPHNDASAPWTPARIRTALDAGRGERRREATVAWLTSCIIEQKQHGTRDCTRQQQALDYASDGTRAMRSAAEASFAAVTRPRLHARLSEQLRRENLQLEELIESGGELGALATQRYYINLEYFRYLNGNGQDPLFGAMQNFRADALGGPRLSLLGNILFTCRKAPCIYEWSGFEIERPEEDAADDFRVVPVVPGGNTREPGNPVKP